MTNPRLRLPLALALAAKLALVALFVTPALAYAQERYAIGGDHVAIYNLAGLVDIVGTGAGQVTVEVERGGRDAGELRVEVGRVAGVHALRVIYPANRVVYRADDGLFRSRGTTRLRVREDGTWGGDGDRGRRVTLSSGGSGMEAHANLRIGVPRGQRVEVHLGLGGIVAENVDGDVRLQTTSGGVEARGLAGHLDVRTGSGNVRLDGMGGSLVVRTGSGRIRVAAVQGDSVVLRTGSGGVNGEDVVASVVRVRTGSGRVQLSRSAGTEVQVNTGSGSVAAELVRAVDRLQVRTGSGGVTLDLAADLDATLAIRTGSGRITTDLPVQVTTHERRQLRGVVGAGTGTLDIRTGSGSVRLRSL
jgi:lia operon protein LiaG